MTKEEKSKIKYRMKCLARKFCKRNDVYRSFDSSVGELIEKAYFSAYLLCLHENKNKIAELEGQVARAFEVLEGKRKQIADLEKEKCELLGIIQGKDTAIQDLQKENAELKEQNKKLLESCAGATMMYEHLTKAKEILQVVFDKWKEERWILQSEEEVRKIENLMEQAEQFLKE